MSTPIHGYRTPVSSGSGPASGSSTTRGELIVLVGHAAGPARDPAIAPAAGPAAIRFVVLLVVLEFADLLAGRVARIVALAIVIVQRRLRDACRARRTAGRAGTRWSGRRRRRCRNAEACPRRIEMRIEERERQRLAVDVVRPAERELLAVAEQVFFLELDRARVFSTLAAEVDTRVQRPGIARAHFEIDRLAVPGHRTNGCVIKVVVGAQDALGFLDDTMHVRLALAKQQLRPYDLRPCIDVQLVRGAIHPRALAGNRRIEDVADDDLDLADDGSRRFEFRTGRDAGGPGMHGRFFFEGGRRLARQRRLILRARSRDLAGRDEQHQCHRQPGEVRSWMRQGSSTVEPIVRRASRSRCACATSRSG